MALFAGIALAAPAMAQATGSDVGASSSSVLSGVNTGPETEAGIHIGAFMLYPTVDVKGQYNDNVFAQQTGAQDDFSYLIAPQLLLRSTWTHYLLVFKAQGDIQQYDKFTSENRSDYLFGGEFKFDLGVATQVDLNSEYARLTEARGNTNFITAQAKPASYDRWNNTADFKHVFNRLQVDAGGTYTTLRFENVPAIGGGTVLEVVRDRDVSSEYLDLGYQFSPGYQVFVRGTLNQRDYRLAISHYRNSNGYEADAGVRMEITHLINAQAYLGYLSQDYKTFKTLGGFDYGLQLNWSVTPLTTVTADVSRSIEETDEVTAAAYFASTASLTVTHSLTRTVTLNAGVSYDHNDYKGISRNEDIYSATVGADYGLTPYFHVTADYRYATRNSDIPLANYDQNVVEAGVKLAL